MVLTRQEMPTVPAKARELFRQGTWSQRTSGVCVGYTNANLCIVPRELAFDLLLYCQRNPKPCPVLEVLEPGDPIVKQMADGADIRTDLPMYRVLVRGEVVDEPTDITRYWRDDLVTFLYGCSGTFESALEGAGISPRWRQGEASGSGIYRTNIPTVPAGSFHGNMVVSMRPIPSHQVSRAVQATSRFPGHHGAPVHIGDPAAIGIPDLSRAEWAPVPTLQPGEVPVFWACGVTLQVVAQECKPELMLTHYPGRMFISDIPSEQQAVL
tara:strand:- start:100 stop:903 length:804 start_codon:yes stop_codon:yes gene_type:complete